MPESESEEISVPIVERRKVVIDVSYNLPPAPVSGIIPPQRERSFEELVEEVRRELIRRGSRDPDIFGGRA